MFGFSLPKILVLAAIVLGVWYGFQWLSRRGQMISKRGQGDQGNTPPEVEDMVKCDKCGVFYPPATGHECAH